MMYLASLAEETKDKVDGYKFIHTKTELDIIVTDNKHSNKVIIRQDFAHEFFTPTGLISYIKEVRKINYNIIIEVDIKDGVLTKENIIYKIKNCRNIEEMIDLMVYNETEFMDVVASLIKHHDESYSGMLEYSNQVSRLQSIVEELTREIKDKDYLIKEANRNTLSYQSKLHSLVSRINFQYNKGIDESKLFKVNKNSYDKILYIKEITRVQYVDTFVYYLKEILKTLYMMPTRVLVIESYYAEGKIPLYPNLKPHHELIERDVIKGDILMLGMQPNLMEDILKNSSNISILIVLDRAGYAIPHMEGDNVEVLYTLSDINDKPDWIPNQRCISYSEDTLFIKYIKNFKDVDSSAKISLYSSMEITKKVVRMLERK